MLHFSAMVQADTFVFPIASDGVELPELTSAITKAYAALGHEVEIESMPAKRALLEAAHNEKFDGELVRVIEAESLFHNLIRIPVPVFEADLIAVTRNSDFSVSSIEALSEYRLGAIRGIVFTDRAFENMPTVEFLNELEQGWRMLDLRRIDVLVVPKMMAKMFTPNNESRPTLYFHTLPIPSFKLYHYVHNKHADLVPDLAKALSDITGHPIEAASTLR